MSMTPVLTKNFRCHGVVNNYRIVIMSDTIPNAVRTTHAAGPVGITADRGGVDGDDCDVIMLGIGQVLLSGTVTAGQAIQSDPDNSGRGQGNADIAWRVGRALRGGVAGDIIPVFICPN